MKMNSRLVKGAAALALVALVAAPLSASAVPGKGANKAPKANVRRSATANTRLAAKQAELRNRIARVLSKRSATFNAAATRIASRIERVASLTTSVTAAGGDVTAVLAKLEAARTAVTAARAAEAEAMEMFKAVPSATDKKAAFAAAKAKARTARALLADARSALRNAILTLKVVVGGLTPVTP